MELPSVFSSRINEGLMHQALMRQQSNRRNPIAHAKKRGEVVGTTKKAFQQKGTGRARRGAARSPLLRGGGKTFGPQGIENYQKAMPKTMRRTALASCLSYLAKHERILGLESFGDTMKTKTFTDMLKKMPVEHGRRLLIVIPAHHKGLELSARNVDGVKTLLASYINPEDLLTSKKVIFLTEAIDVVQKLLTEGGAKMEKPVEEVKEEKPKAVKKKAAPKKKSAPKAKKSAK